MLEAISQHITCFAALARHMAGKETHENRRNELLTIAKNCEVIGTAADLLASVTILCYFVKLIL